MASYPIKLSHVILILSFETLAADLFCSATTRIEYLEEHIQSQSLKKKKFLSLFFLFKRTINYFQG